MRKNHSYTFALGLVLAGGTFCYEFVSPSWATLGYLLVAICLFFHEGRISHAIILGIVTSICILTGFSLNPPLEDQFTLSVANRILCLGAVWIAFFSAKSRKQEITRVAAADEESNARAREHTSPHDTIEALKAEKKHRDNEIIRGKRLYDAMAHHFPDGVICVVNKDMKYVLADGRGLNELGLSGVDIRGEHVAIGSGQELKRAFSGEVVSFETNLNNDAYTVNAIPIPDSKDEINEILIVIRNISDRKKLENNLIKALEKEKELNLLMSQFVTMASHKFRTPLSTILSSVFLLENNIEADEQEQKSYFDKIKRAVHNVTGLLNDFLSLGKLEEGKVKVAFSETEIKSFFQEFLQEIGPIKKAKQKILFNYDGVACTVMTDQLLLKNILMSLLSNAIEYSSFDAEIQLEVELKKDNLKIKVSDHGIGIPEEEQHQIFKRFYRGQNANNIEGTGLGLNIAKKYIRLLKGTIEFTSQVNKGTTFITNIPVVTLDILEKQA